MAQITLRDYLQEIEDAISSKRVDEALASCQYVLAFFPESLEAQRLLGEVYLAQGKLEDAQQAFDWVLTNDPENVIAYCSRALVSERMSDYDTALDCYQQAYELSRGNGQIRQAFNQLSEKVGQQGFMFSRAGLARLYMRGDLLTQASQEWDIVLSMFPDRLDARTGLLEVYWRQGSYDQAAQLSEQILQDVPGCIKALLLQAYVTATQDMLRSQELIKQVEALDPDLVLAHDLFADHLAKQAGDPFLKLLSKAPAVLGTADSAAKLAPSQTEDALSAWGSNANWNNDETLVKPRSNQSPSQADISSRPSWMSEGLTPSGSGASHSGTSSWDNDAWSAPAHPQASTTDAQPDQAEPWQLLQNTLNSISPDVVKQTSNSGLEDSNAASWSGTSGIGFVPQPSEATASESQDTDFPADDHFGQDAGQSWSFAIPSEAKNSPAVPAWLNMLAQNEPKSLPSDQPVAQEPSVEKPPVEKTAVTEDPISQTPASSSSPSATPVPPQTPAEPSEVAEAIPEKASTMPSEEGEDAEEESLFGPDWLKSIGAASLDGTGAYNFSELAQQQSSDISQQKEAAAASADVSAPRSEISAPNQKSSGASWEQPSAQQKSSGASWEQPKQPVVQPQAQGFHDPSWLLASPSQAQKQQSSPAWEQPPVEKQPEEHVSSWAQSQEPTQAASSPGESALNQLVEESQNSAAENDPWAAWQAVNVPSQLSQQPVEKGQDYWSSSQVNRETETFEQPSWMQQLSQSGTSSSSQNANSTYEESAPQPEPSWHEMQSQTPAYEELVQSEESTPASEPVQPVVEDPWAILNQQAQSQTIDYDWLAQLASGNQQREATPAARDELATEPVVKPEENQQASNEQNLVTTLEELEQKLLSRGFTPLEPNSLASIAQTQENGQAVAEQPQETTNSVNNQPAAEPEPSLFSALTELGHFFPRPAEPTPVESQTPSVEPSWLAALGTVPAADNTSASEAQIVKQPASEAEQPSVDTRQSDPELAQPPVTPPLPVEAAFRPSDRAAVEPAVASVARVNPLLDSELETTMKRPAVRLQPMQRTTTRDLGNPAANRNRGSERTGQRVADSGGNVSHRERLIRGYQAQLVGDFDNAMQEYRVIIRNAPELLGEVVSNVRALLKLAPNYSSGYRVLGDAYMRQGEYLQAMEAYNRALTMAKKAKG